MDLEIHLFVEMGMWGGISMVRKRYAKANNPLLPDFDPIKPNNYIMYLDANNFYGWAMSKPLPKKRFQMETCHAHRGGDPQEKRERKEWLDF